MSGCQKEILSPTQISKQESRTPTIKIDEVKEWYQRAKATFDREKNLRSGSTGLDGVVPDWHFFQNSYNTIGQEFGVAPLNFVVGSKGFARLLISRDSTRNLIGKYAIYLPDSVYRLQTHSVYSAQTFTGLVFYFNSDGTFSHGNEYKNGVRTRDASIIDRNRANITPRDCWNTTFTLTTVIQLGAYSDEVPDIGTISTTYSVTICGGGNGSFGGSTGNDSGGGGNIDPSDAFLGAGLDGFMGVLDGEVPVNNLISRFPSQANFINSIITLNNKFGGQLDRNIIPLLYSNQGALTQANNYLANSSSASDKETVTKHLNLLNTKSKYLKKNQDAGFPDIGTNDWYETLNFTYTSPTNGLNYNVNFTNNNRTQEALFAREFGEATASQIDVIFDRTIGQIGNTTTQNAGTFTSDIELNGGFALTSGNRKAAILSYNVGVQKIVDPTINPNGITIFNNISSNPNYFSGIGNIGMGENPVIKREDFNTNSFRSLNCMEISGVNPNPNNLIYIRIGLSLVDIFAR